MHRGRLRKQIAHDIGIAEATVKVHRMRAVQKITDAFPKFNRRVGQTQAAARIAATLVNTCLREALFAGISGPAAHGLVEPVMPGDL